MPASNVLSMLEGGGHIRELLLLLLQEGLERLVRARIPSLPQPPQKSRAQSTVLFYIAGWGCIEGGRGLIFLEAGPLDGFWMLVGPCKTLSFGFLQMGVV